MAKLLSDYVKAYDNTLSPGQCQALIDRFEAASDLHERKQAEGSYSFVQMSVSRHWPEVRPAVSERQSLARG